MSQRSADTVRDDSNLLDKHWVTTPYRPEQQARMVDAVSGNINIGTMPEHNISMLLLYEVIGRYQRERISKHLSLNAVCESFHTISDCS